MQQTQNDAPEQAAPDPGWVVVRDSRIHGNGVFAARCIPAGTELMEYVGERITKADSLERCLAGNVYVFTLDDEWDLDGSVDPNPARFANHSCAPNCESIMDENDRIWIVALRDIQAGEEITYNYGYDLEDYPDHPCRCGAPDCIGFIVAEELLPIVRERLALAASATLPPVPESDEAMQCPDCTPVYSESNPRSTSLC
jgi:uncharacterized protein